MIKDKEKKPKEKKVKEPKPKAPAVSWGERLSNYICPMLLGGAVCFSVIYVLYQPFAAFYTALFLVAELFLFVLFDKLKTIKILGGLMYMLMLGGAWFGSILMLVGESSGLGWGSAMTWFYGEEGSSSYHPGFLNAVLLGGGFFLISILYYFTQIRYRSLGVMLCLLFPFVIYAKRADTMPDALVTVIISLFLAVMVHNRRIDPSVPPDRRGVLIVNTAYIISVAVFVSITGAVTMMIDKPTYFSKLEKDSNYFDYYRAQGTGSGGYDDLNDQSSTRRGGLDYTYNPIFYFETDGTEPEYYLRRQVYNNFDGTNWDSTISNGEYGMLYSADNPEYGTDDILNDIEELSEEDSSFPSPAKRKKTLTERTGKVYDEDFAPTYLPAPISVVTDTEPRDSLKYEKTDVSVMRRAAMWYSPIPALNDTFTYYEYEAGLNMYAGSFKMSGDEYKDKLTELADSGSDPARRLLLNYMTASTQYLDISRVNDRIVQLSYEITKDCKNDYEKAHALEQYFSKEGFEYSLEYVPEDDSIEYFIFDSKKGYCVAYATAMTLMARSVGMPARYVEGFAAFEYTGDGNTMVVRDGHAHAFVEVYIPGAGWLTFDPTVADYRNNFGDNGSSFNWQTFLRIISRFILVIIVGFVIIFVLLLDRIIELIFRIRLMFKDPARRTTMLYANVIKLVNFSTREDYSAYTVKMLREYLYRSRGVCPEALLELFERTAFGGMTPTNEEFAAAYKDYRRCYKYLRRLPRPKELEKMRMTQ